ncbi:MAG: hypothetical protein GXP55_18725 [Deltaproteobacteria bacterium]|nr:hypothetical protein [Deltaproteobacteria bacterium]
MFALINPSCTCQGPLPPFDPPTASCDIAAPDFDTSRLDPCVYGELVGHFVLTPPTHRGEDDDCEPGEDGHGREEDGEGCADREDHAHHEHGSAEDADRPDSDDEHDAAHAEVDDDHAGSDEDERDANEIERSVPLPDGRVCVRVVARGGASASVSLGTAALFGPGDFTSDASALQRVVPSTAGSTSFEAELAPSPPGSRVSIDIRALPSAPDPQVVAAETDLSQLQGMVCDEFNLNVDALLDPKVAAALTAGLLEGGRPLGRMQLHRNAYGIPSFIGPLPTGDSPSMPGASPESIARDWALRHEALMQLAGSELVYDHQELGPVGEATVVFGQRIGALPVFDSVLAFFVDNVGVVREIRGQLVPASELMLPSAPLTEADAMVRAEAALVARGITPQTAPFAVQGIHDLSQSTFRADLALAFLVRYPGEVSVFVDAGTGEVREVRSEQTNDFYIHVAEFTRTDRAYPLSIPAAGSLEEPFTPTRIRTTPTQPGDTDGPVANFGCFLDPPAPPGAPPGNRDATCTILVGNLSRADFFYRTVWGRDGWSDGKASRGGEYALIYGQNFAAEGNLNCYPGALSAPGCDASTRQRVAVGGAALSADAITHEFGHGFLSDPAVRVRTFESGTSSLTGQGYLGEHVGDVIAALTQLSISGGRPEEGFRTSLTEGRAVRDHTFFGCEGYHLPPPAAGERPLCDTIDINLRGADNNPRALGCREYVHMDFLANRDAPGPIHENSCMYSHVGYLLAQEGALPSLRGVTTPGAISRELLAEFYRKLYSAPHTSPRANDYWDYATSFRTVIPIVVDRCASGALPGIPECDELSALGDADRIAMTSELAERFTAALWAEGFWSDPDLLSWRSDVAPVVVSARDSASSASALHAFYIDGSDALQMVTYTDPTDAGRTQSGPFDLGGLAGAPVNTIGPMAVTSDSSGDIRLAYVDSVSGEVALLSRSAGSWSTASLPFATSADQGLAVALLDDGRSLIVAATRGLLQYYFDDSSAVEGELSSGFGSLASQPTLTTLATPAGPTILLAFVSPDAAATAPRGRLEYQLFDPTSDRFAPGDQLRVLASPGPRSTFPYSLDSRSARTPENLGMSSCVGGLSECSDFIGTECVGFLAARCELKSCTTDADCTAVAGTSGGAHVSCVAGTCGSFTRFPITARDVSTGPTLVPFVDSGSARRLHVFVPSARRGDASDPGGLTFANLVPTLSGGSIDFDGFHASRQVRLADDASYAHGYAAAAFDRPTGDRVEVLLGVDVGGRVRLVWRRSE